MAVEADDLRFDRDFLAQFAQSGLGECLAKLDKPSGKREGARIRRPRAGGKQHAILPEDGDTRRQPRLRRIEPALRRIFVTNLRHG